MFSFSNISIKAKILLLFLIPTIALFYQVSIRSFNKYSDVEANKVTKQYVKFSVVIASLVNELQKERGMTAGFIGSRGKKFTNDLPAQRAKTNAKVKALQVSMQHLQQMHLHESVAFKYDLKAAIKKLSKLQYLRSQVTALSIPKARAIAFYTNLDKMMLETIASISKQSINPAIIKEISSYVNFLQAKEHAGIERAVGTGAFASKSMSLKTKLKFASLRAQQKAFLESFTVLASKNMKHELQSIESKEVFTQVNNMAKILLNATRPSDFTISASKYFKTITHKINLMHFVGNKFATGIEKNIATQIHKNKTILFELLLFNILLIAILAFMGFIIIANIANTVARLQKHMRTIAQTKDLTLVASIDSKDELGQITKELNILISTINCKKLFK